MTAGSGPAPKPAPALSPEERDALYRGAEQLAGGYFFEAHDTLEEAWSGIRGEPRDFFQGLIQVAVGLYHWRNGNFGGAATMLDRAAKRLFRYPDLYCGLELATLRQEIRVTREQVADGRPFPESREGLPRFRLEG